jgi:hypothetical protein
VIADDGQLSRAPNQTDVRVACASGACVTHVQ